MLAETSALLLTVTGHSAFAVTLARTGTTASAAASATAETVGYPDATTGLAAAAAFAATAGRPDAVTAATVVCSAATTPEPLDQVPGLLCPGRPLPRRKLLQCRAQSLTRRLML